MQPDRNPPRYLHDAFSTLATPHVADACYRLGVPLRVAPPGIQPLTPHHRVAGAALPVRHAGSVDVFLEAIHGAPAGSVLVVDNGGRVDEGCIGDLTALEAKGGGLRGIVVWGLHRDSSELGAIEFPLFSYGRCPAGPRGTEGRNSEQPPAVGFGAFTVSRADAVFGDEDGVLFLALDDAGPVLEMAASIAAREREQAAAIARGSSLYDQLRFAEYVAQREQDPSYTFRRHLRSVAGAIEE